MTSPQPPAFLDTDPSAIVADLVATYEVATGKTLYPAQVERLWIDLMAYRESLVRHAIQDAAEQNLVAYAAGRRLESLGLLLGVTSRVPAAKATVPWTITLAGVAGTDTVFPTGWQAMGPNGSAWATLADGIVPAGQLSVNVTAEAVAAGEAENGIPGETAFSPLLGTATVASTADSAGGADAESDEQLRARILLAPFGFSVAGSSGAYRFHALGSNPGIIDVAVTVGNPGEVRVYPLTKTGLPDAAVLADVAAALNADTVRPLCDSVTVAAPTQVTYTLEANLTTYATADAAAALAAAQAAAAAFTDDRRAGLGRDLIASQAIKALSVEGIYKVELVGWADRILGAQEWADGSVILHLTGAVNG